MQNNISYTENNEAGGPSLPLQYRQSNSTILDSVLKRLDPDSTNSDLNGLPRINQNILDASPNLEVFEGIAEQYEVFIEDLNQIDIMVSNQSTVGSTFIDLMNSNRNHIDSLPNYDDPRALLALKYSVAITSVKHRLESVEYAMRQQQLNSILEGLHNELENLKVWHPTQDLTPRDAREYVNQLSQEEKTVIHNKFLEEQRRLNAIHDTLEEKRRLNELEEKRRRDLAQTSLHKAKHKISIPYGPAASSQDKVSTILDLESRIEYRFY